MRNAVVAAIVVFSLAGVVVAKTELTPERIEEGLRRLGRFLQSAGKAS